jgi:hypothetical protein
VLEFLEPVGKAALPVAIITAALIWPRPEPVTIEVDFPESAPAVVNMSTPEFPAFPEVKVPVVTVKPGEPVVTEKQIPGPVVFQDREVTVERVVEVPSCLNYAELPYFDLANAVSVTRPGESWSLSGDYYNGLAWLDSTPKPSFSEIVGGWLRHLESQCE